MTYFRGYLALLAAATLVLAGASLLRVIDAPATPGPAPPALRTTLDDVGEVPGRERILGYSREEFGSGWSTSSYRGCDMRELMLLSAVVGEQSGCETVGTVVDPYTGEDITIAPSADPAEIDHVLPLSAAWDLGAHAWSVDERRDFANDPRNLVVTSRAANQEKSDALPAAWLPPHPGTRCWYVRRLAQVAAAYELPLPAEDSRVMQRQCGLREVLRR